MRVCLDANRKSGPADDFILSFMAKYCPQGAILAPHIDVKSVLRAESCLCNFGLKQGSFHVAVEKSGLWTARLSTKGTRAVVVVDIDDVKEMMKKQSLAGKDCKAFMKDLGVAGASDYVNSGYKIFFGTVSLGDLLWVPANVVVLEQVADIADVFGLRCAMLTARDSSRYATFTAVASNKMTPSTDISKAIVAAVKAVATDVVSAE